MSAMEQLDCYLDREYVDYGVDELTPQDQRFRIETKDQAIPHTGEMVPGIEVQERAEKFVIEVEGL